METQQARTGERANAPDDGDRLNRDVARLLASLVRPTGTHESVQVRRLLPNGPERYAWTGRMSLVPPRTTRHGGP